MKTILAIETGSPVLSVALGTASGKIRTLKSPAPLRHSENLVPFIDRLLRKEKLSLAQIDALALNRGPGSFTGLRIGFSLLKGFLAVRKKPCYGALSLDMIAAKVRPVEGSRLGVLVDARRQAVYGRFYRARKGSWLPETKPEILSLSELIKKIQEGIAPQGQSRSLKRKFINGMYLAGDALPVYGEVLEQAFGQRIHLLPRNVWFPSAVTLVEWFQAGDARLAPLSSASDFVPLYFRRSEAEEKRTRLKTYAA